ncbi:MAG TPA: acyl-CoA dehydrogenase family protein [Candidatus Krumholzibacteria bacterium]|nr:acyl-CoA dehydrogenase family protein [Candidatus Krumholzibacteria bacterium]
MDFSWSEEQTNLRESIATFAREELNQGLIERDQKGEFNREGWDKCARMGVHGLPVPTAYGGLGMDALTTVGVLESLGYGCEDNGLVFSINAHMWTLETPIMGFGTEEQKKRLLPKLTSGEWIGANAMSEPGSGSDAYSIATTAKKKGDVYLLNGSKVFCSNGPIADVYLAFANVDPALGANGVTGFLVERTSPGLSLGKHTEKMGLRTSPMCEVFFEDCEVPEANRLGREGAGKMLFADSMSWERGCILASAVGTMRRLLETSIAYATSREQFGQPIGKFQMVQSKIVDMKLRLDTARAFLYQSAYQKSRGKSVYLEAAMAKLYISESWIECARHALQIHGGYGYTVEYKIERELRDALASTLFSGTSEIQRTIIASLMGL